MADDWDGDNWSSGSSFVCGPDLDRVMYEWTSKASVMSTGEVTKRPYPIVYGQGLAPSVVSVDVTGEGVDFTIPVKPEHAGFGASVPLSPGTSSRRVAPEELHLTFLDAQDQVVDSMVVRAES